MLDRRVGGCRACPRLVDWREEVARTKRAAFADWTYWGRPVPGFGPADARLLIVGLAPAAHGGNRTGRMFTGDRSGDVLYQALYDVGLASQPTAVSVDDGLELYGVRITSPVHCAPPANKPTPGERDTCRPWLVQELRLLRPTLRAVVVLGAFGWQAALPAFAEAGWTVPRPRPAFGHGTRLTLDGPARPDDPEPPERPDDPEPPHHPHHPHDPDGPRDPDGPDHSGGSSAADGLDVFGCFHVSQRNTFTGRLTPGMLRDVLRTAAGVAGLP
ncbi:uracil-DNA glycosylase [Streptomyces sp. Root1310]|uniref:uracil-DNA glycosylase n=1 Tax=Streptomyces sp. Root1310 TaxID=1736452 RepID=UPI000708C28E|nr:uracil-DNA glycosylase [Streptomyces sp. Root1310]KQX83442.1 uracil-DNA glycosylase [Streptomyces sp. Root1310]